MLGDAFVSENPAKASLSVSVHNIFQSHPKSSNYFHTSGFILEIIHICGTEENADFDSIQLVLYIDVCAVHHSGELTANWSHLSKKRFPLKSSYSFFLYIFNSQKCDRSWKKIWKQIRMIHFPLRGLTQDKFKKIRWFTFFVEKPAVKTFRGERRLWPQIEGGAIFLYGPRESQQSWKKGKCLKSWTWKCIFSFTWVDRLAPVAGLQNAEKLSITCMRFNWLPLCRADGERFFLALSK